MSENEQSVDEVEEVAEEPVAEETTISDLSDAREEAQGEEVVEEAPAEELGAEAASSRDEIKRSMALNMREKEARKRG